MDRGGILVGCGGCTWSANHGALFFEISSAASLLDSALDGFREFLVAASLLGFPTELQRQNGPGFIGERDYSTRGFEGIFYSKGDWLGPQTIRPVRRRLGT